MSKIYYDNIKKQTKDLSFNMRAFHNNIKRMLLYAISNKIPTSQQFSLLDLACGQLGDLYKWYDAHIDFVWGIEINKNNLYKKDGAISRYKSFLKEHSDMKVKLTCADASLPITIIKPFNCISCQFALNYFLETPEKLDGLLNNVANALRLGNYFIGTVIDGQSVYNLLDNKDKVNGITEHGDLIWEITKAYPNDQPFLKYGQTINMYMSSIGDKPITEYLVNFDYIIEKCSEYHLELITSEMFDTIYNNNIKQIDDIILNWNYKISPLSDPEKQLSFLNRYFIFKKIS